MTLAPKPASTITTSPHSIADASLSLSLSSPWSIYIISPQPPLYLSLPLSQSASLCSFSLSLSLSYINTHRGGEAVAVVAMARALAPSLPPSISDNRHPKPFYSNSYKRLSFKNLSNTDFVVRAGREPRGKQGKQKSTSKRSLRSSQPAIGLTADVQDQLPDVATDISVEKVGDITTEEVGVPISLGHSDIKQTIRVVDSFDSHKREDIHLETNVDHNLAKRNLYLPTIQSEDLYSGSTNPSNETGSGTSEGESNKVVISRKIENSNGSDTKMEAIKEPGTDFQVKEHAQEDDVRGKGLPIKGEKNEKPSKLESNQRNLEILNLAESSAISDRKIFYYPECVKAGMEVEIFLNRSISSLASKPSIFALGAFNDWRWKSFVLELRKSTFPGDWWSFKLQVPRETYKIDFVFFDGGKIYENNSRKDFHIVVEDGMDKKSFEDYLNQEKLKEAERLAAEEAERKRKAEEERRIAEAKAADEADMLEAKRQVNEMQERAVKVVQRAVKAVDGLWRFEPSDFKEGDVVQLLYNRKGRPLASSKEIWIHGGYNNWQDMVSFSSPLSCFSSTDGDWWAVNVVVPQHAYVLDWVFADGPPNEANIYDNNSYQDFHGLVPRPMDEDLYWEEVKEVIYQKLREERHVRGEAARKKAEYTALLKEKLREKTKQTLLRSQSRTVYTYPVSIQAGKPVTIYYNPTNTVLNGKPEIWLRGAFNRWTHREGPLPPVRMQPTESGTYLKATVHVPIDAYFLDFVFSERGGENGGIYDNKNGLDYHFPVLGGIVKEPPMHVVHISVEMAPIAKVGGLGDVVTGLSRTVQDMGHNVEIIVPKYDCLDYKRITDLREKSDFFLGGTRVKVWNGKVEGLPVIFLEPDNGMFWVGCVYGRRDDGQRFGFFCNAALEYLLKSGSHPDIIHCHDWSSAPVAWLYQEGYKHYGLSNAHVIFTIHNLEFGTSLIGKAMAHADKATTVSFTYAQEVAGNSAIAPYLRKFYGIRNGIDIDIWDPFNDPFIPMSYTSENAVEGKKAAKTELQAKLGLAQVDRPLVGIITRLTAQKGIHLIKHAIWRTLERGGQVVLLGSAPDPRIQNDFNGLANQLHSTKGEMARLCLSYDEPLSHLIYAASDFILVPSMFEPCGLTQLVAMRYGAIPVVRRTGGLNDTVFDLDHGQDHAKAEGLEANGFSFDSTDASGLDYALNRAITAWYDAHDWIVSVRKQVMEQDWSWNRPALDYIELYYGASK